MLNNYQSTVHPGLISLADCALCVSDYSNLLLAITPSSSTHHRALNSGEYAMIRGYEPTLLTISNSEVVSEEMKGLIDLRDMKGEV